MTTRVGLFNSPLLLGFDHFERTLDRVAKGSSDGYPPYNIEQVALADGADGIRISLAVAGFTEEDLQVYIDANQLVIRGRQQDDQDRVYLHRGIASRQFQRPFVLADGLRVLGAHLDNGLLHIDLERPLPDARVQHIAIRSTKRDPGPDLMGQPVRAARPVIPSNEPSQD